MDRKNPDDYTDAELKGLFHNHHEAAFRSYLGRSRHSVDKQRFLFGWLAAGPADFVLECGSSGGKTSMDLAARTGCRCLGIDFDQEAVRISTKMRKEHFPGLEGRCEFALGDLATMRFDPGITKVLMPDFTEHIPDRTLARILENLRSQFENVELYIYTPCRSHIFEIMKHNGILLSNPSGHVNVKTTEDLIGMLDRTGWSVTRSGWHYSSMWYVRAVERALAWLPLVGKYFRRRIALVAVPARPRAAALDAAVPR